MNMQQDEDEKFENFLRQFRPRVPQPLRIEEHERVARRRFVFGLSVATSAAALLVAVFIGSRPSHTPTPNRTQTVSSIGLIAEPQPLTLGRANALLMQAPSISAALDSIAAESQNVHVQKGARSALATLAQADFKEKIKL